MTENWKLWQAEQVRPTPEERRHERTTVPTEMTGYWRIERSKMKGDWPVVIWTRDGEEHTTFQIGAMHPMNTLEHPDEWRRLVDQHWLHAVAVTREAWAKALETGRWADGKPVREETEAERHNIDMGQGGNQAPLDISLEVQIRELSIDLREAKEPTTQAEADALTGLTDKMRALLKLAEVERVREKEPFLEGGRSIDNKWRGIMSPGSTAYDDAEKLRKAFLKKEQARREAEARAETKRRQDEAAKAAEEERQRIAAETAKRLEEENKLREQAGQATDTPEDIEQKATEEAAQLVPEPVVEEAVPERATAGTAYGRQSGLRKVKKGKIIDAGQFATALVDMKHKDMLSLLQQLADRAAKAGMVQPGIQIVEEYE